MTIFPADFLVNMSASADVLAMAKVEVDLSAIPEGKNVSYPHVYHQLEMNNAIFKNPVPLTHSNRLSSNGVESLSLSATAQRMRLKKPKMLRWRLCAILNQMRSVSRSQNGSSWSASVHIWVVCRLARPATLEAGSAHATDLITISRDV
jgi:hypothetical protein